MFKVGVVGTGGMGITHVEALKPLEKEGAVEVCALADAGEENLKKAAALFPSAKLYADGQTMIEREKLDAVHICVPSYLHADLAVLAMEHGIHVLVEKPACLTEADCERLLETKQRTGVKVMVGQVVRFFPEYRCLREAYRSGKYGVLKSLEMQRLSGDVNWGYEDWFHDENKSGSVVLDLHIHDLDFLRYTFGEPSGMRCVATAFPNGMVNQIVTSYQFEKVDAFISAEALWGNSPSYPFTPRFYAQFEEADISFDGRDKPDTIKIYHRDGSIEKPDVSESLALEGAGDINFSASGPYFTEINYFYHCLRENAEPKIASLKEGIASVRLAIREWELAKNYLKEKKS